MFGEPLRPEDLSTILGPTIVGAQAEFFFQDGPRGHAAFRGDISSIETKDGTIIFHFSWIAKEEPGNHWVSWSIPGAAFPLEGARYGMEEHSGLIVLYLGKAMMMIMSNAYYRRIPGDFRLRQEQVSPN